MKTNDAATSRAGASSLPASFFFEIACEEGVDFEAFESRRVSLGRSVIADAMSTALERLDARLCLELPEGCRAHDGRKRTLAGEAGDLKFGYRRARDAFGSAVVPYADAPDLPRSARRARGEAVPYRGRCRRVPPEGGEPAGAQRLARERRHRDERGPAGRRAVRGGGRRAGRGMFVDGIVPDGEVESKQAPVEADGTWVRLRDVKEGEPERDLLNQARDLQERLDSLSRHSSAKLEIRRLEGAIAERDAAIARLRSELESERAKAARLQGELQSSRLKRKDLEALVRQLKCDVGNERTRTRSARSNYERTAASHAGPLDGNRALKERNAELEDKLARKDTLIEHLSAPVARTGELIAAVVVGEPNRKRIPTRASRRAVGSEVAAPSRPRAAQTRGRRRGALRARVGLLPALRVRHGPHRRRTRARLPRLRQDRMGPVPQGRGERGELRPERQVRDRLLGRACNVPGDNAHGFVRAVTSGEADVSSDNAPNFMVSSREWAGLTCGRRSTPSPLRPSSARTPRSPGPRGAALTSARSTATAPRSSAPATSKAMPARRARRSRSRPTPRPYTTRRCLPQLQQTPR